MSPLFTNVVAPLTADNRTTLMTRARRPAGHTLTRMLTAAAATVAATTLLLAGAPTAEASSRGVAPGDEIDTHGGKHDSRCTLGYTFTDPISHITYGLTAGHCNEGPHSPVIDRTTGATGRFAYSESTPAEPLYADFGIIDFGTNRAVKWMYQHQPVGSIAAIDATKPVCHDGIKTGIACGRYAGGLIADQYLTTGMPRSIPGDSGGPVWQPGRDGSAAIIGIWLGQHDDQDGTYGRFTSITDVLLTLSGKAHAAIV